MPAVSRSEAWLLAAASVVLVAGVASVPFVYDDSEPSSSGPAPSSTPTAFPSATTSPTTSPAAEPLRVSAVRITTYSRGSHQLVVRAHVSTGSSAVLLVGGRSYPMRLSAGEVTGAVPVTCGAAVPALVLVVTTADGEQSQPLGQPTAAFAEACATPRPGGPIPTATVGS